MFVPYQVYGFLGSHVGQLSVTFTMPRRHGPPFVRHWPLMRVIKVKPNCPEPIRAELLMEKVAVMLRIAGCGMMDTGVMMPSIKRSLN
jgi:hypothetical protein